MPPPEINALNLRIGLDFVRTAFFEDTAIIHDRDALNNAERNIEVVLDDDIADVARERLKDLDQLAALRWRQTGCGFVEQDEARRTCERDANFQLTLLSIAQRTDEHILEMIETDRMRHLASGLAARIAYARTQQAETPVHDTARSKKKIIENAKSLKQQRDLIGPPQTAPDPVMRLQAGDIFAEKQNAARRRGKVAGDRIEKSRFARTVRTKQGAAFSGTELHVNSVERNQRAETPAYALKGESVSGCGFGNSGRAFRHKSRP
jgi:hypothetical protein